MDAQMIIVMGVAMMVVGVGFLFLLFRGNGWKAPRDTMEWTGTVLSVLVIAAAAGLMAMAQQINEAREVAAGQVATPAAFEDAIIEVPAGNFSFTSLESGEQMELEDYRGKVVILNFWATWCAPCLKEIPDLNRLQRNYADSGLVIVSLSDETKEVLENFEEQMPLATTSVMMPPTADLPVPFRGAFNIRPASYVVDREGTVRRYVLGARSYAFFEEAILPYL